MCQNNEILAYCRVLLLLFTVYSDTTVVDFYYTDLRKTSDDLPGTWLWGDGTLLDYDKWKEGYPKDVEKTKTKFLKETQLMEDSSGNAPYHFICEKSNEDPRGKCVD